MGLYKLREWVGTVTGKGVRWGRDRLGRSAPAFLGANTTALPPLTCTARREAGQLCGSCCFCCEAGQLLAVCFFEACAGWRVRRLCLPAVPVQQAVCLFTLYLPCPLPSSFAPVQVCLPPFSSLCFALFMSMCARIAKTTCLQAARLPRWQLQHGPAVAARVPVPLLTFNILFLQSP